MAKKKADVLGLDLLLDPESLKSLITGENNKPSMRTVWPEPILDGEAHRHQENLASAAASAIASEMNDVEK